MRRLLAAFFLLSAIAAGQPATTPPKNVDVMWAVKVPMRDGVKLNATV